MFRLGGGRQGMPRFSPLASRPSFTGPAADQGVVTPNVESFAPAGGPADGFPGGSPLVDAILQPDGPGGFEPPEPEVDLGPEMPPTDEMPLPAATGEYGTTPYGDVITDAPITQEQVEQAGGVVPDATDPYGVGDWMLENSSDAQNTAAYNRNALLRRLLEEGY